MRRAARPEPDAGDIQALAADRQGGAVVLQHREAAPGQGRGHVAVVVVVAEHGERAVSRRGERREQLATGPTYWRSPNVT